jgi:hypothetical protein
MSKLLAERFKAKEFNFSQLFYNRSVDANGYIGVRIPKFVIDIIKEISEHPTIDLALEAVSAFAFSVDWELYSSEGKVAGAAPKPAPLPPVDKQVGEDGTVITTTLDLESTLEEDWVENFKAEYFDDIFKELLQFGYILYIIDDAKKPVLTRIEPENVEFVFDEDFLLVGFHIDEFSTNVPGTTSIDVIKEPHLYTFDEVLYQTMGGYGDAPAGKSAVLQLLQFHDRWFEILELYKEFLERSAGSKGILHYPNTKEGKAWTDGFAGKGGLKANDVIALPGDRDYTGSQSYTYDEISYTGQGGAFFVDAMRYIDEVLVRKFLPSQALVSSSVGSRSSAATYGLLGDWISKAKCAKIVTKLSRTPLFKKNIGDKRIRIKALENFSGGVKSVRGQESDEPQGGKSTITPPKGGKSASSKSR